MTGAPSTSPRHEGQTRYITFSVEAELVRLAVLLLRYGRDRSPAAVEEAVKRVVGGLDPRFRPTAERMKELVAAALVYPYRLGDPCTDRVVAGLILDVREIMGRPA